MERTITWIASLVALAILLLLPLSYFGLHYHALKSELHLEAEDNARLFTQLINAAPDLWQFQTDHIDELLARRPGDGTPETRRLRDAQARTLAESVVALDEPTLAVTLPVFDAGREAGRVEIERSLRPALLGAGLAALLAALLAGAVFVALRLLPMRALRRAERKAAEQAAHAAFLERAHREASAEARLKSHFLARLTHEIRTPLGGLLGMADSLRNEPLSAAQHRQAQHAHDSGAALLQVVNNMHDYAQLQSNSVTLVRESFDPVLLVESVIERMTPRAQAAGLTLYYQVGPGLPAEMEGDPGRSRQVLNNLVSNAIKFTPRGDVKITVSWVAATVSACAGIHFEVRDTGVGISPDEQAALFRPLPHTGAGGPADADEPGTTGLGLAISRRLVQLMGGQMGLQSPSGRGSKFWFELPQQQSHIVLGQALPAGPTGQPLHVLVADPHTGRARALCCRLLALGVRVNAVHNAGALHTVLAKPRHPFTHALVLSSLKVRAETASPLRWVTLHDGAQHGLEWSDGPATVLQLPCRRDELIQALLSLPPAADDSDDTVRDELAPDDAAQPHDTVAQGADARGPSLDQAPGPGDELPQDPGLDGTGEHGDVREREHRGEHGHGDGAEQDAAPWPELEPRAPLPMRPDLPSVLLVEGNEVSQEVGRALLEAMGCEVYVADGGHEALQRLPQGFGLILLDLQMPGMDGYTTAREIRRWEALLPEPRRTPLVALTADNILEVQDRCAAAGMDDIVSKPVNLEALRETLERHLPELAPA